MPGKNIADGYTVDSYLRVENIHFTSTDKQTQTKNLKVQISSNRPSFNNHKV